MADDENTLKATLEVTPVVSEEGKAAFEAEVAELAKGVGGGDTSTPSGRPAGGGGKGRGRGGGSEKVPVQLDPDLAKLAKDVGSDEYKIKIDKIDLWNQVQEALNAKPFTIKIDGDTSGLKLPPADVKRTATAAAAAVTATTAPVSRGEGNPSLQKHLAAFAPMIESLHGAIKAQEERVGNKSFGRGVENPTLLDKFSDIADVFGSFKLEDLVKLAPATGGYRPIVGGPMSAEALAQRGYKPDEPGVEGITTIENIARQFADAGTKKSLVHSTSKLLGTALATPRETAPEPTAQPAQTPTADVQPAEQRAADPAAVHRVSESRAFYEELRKNKRERAELSLEPRAMGLGLDKDAWASAPLGTPRREHTGRIPDEAEIKKLLAKYDELDEAVSSLDVLQSGPAMDAKGTRIDLTDDQREKLGAAVDAREIVGRQLDYIAQMEERASGGRQSGLGMSAGDTSSTRRLAGDPRTTHIAAEGGAFTGPMSPGTSKEGLTTDAMSADEAARRQRMHNDWMISRGLRPRGGVIGFGNESVDLEPLLRQAEAGGFEDVFEHKTTGEPEQIGVYKRDTKNAAGEVVHKKGDPKYDRKAKTQTDYVQQVADSEEGFKLLQELRGQKHPRPTKFLGQEGTFQRVGATEAIFQEVLKGLGIGGENPEERDPASVAAVREQFDAQMGTVRLATEKGRKPFAGSKRDVKVGSGPADLGAQLKFAGEWRLYAEERIKNLDQFIEILDDRISAVDENDKPLLPEDKRNELTGFRAQHVEERGRMEIAQGLAIDLQKSASGNTDPKERRQLAEAIAARNAAAEARGMARVDSKGFVDRGVGLTPDEEAMHPDRGVRGERAQGREMADLRDALQLPTEESIRNALRSRYDADRARPEGARSAGTLRQIAYGKTGKRRVNLPEETDERDTGGLYAELMRPQLENPKHEQELAKTYFTSIIEGVLGDQSNRRRFAEEDVARAAQSETTRQSPLSRTKTVSSSTQNGRQADIQDFLDQISGALPAAPGIASFEAPANGEGQFSGFAPGAEGRIEKLLDLNRARREGTEPMPPELTGEMKSESPYFDPDLVDPTTGLSPQTAHEQTKAKFANQKAKDDKARLARANTLAASKLLSGDAGRDITRDTGVWMEEEVRGTPYADFEAKYGTNAEAGPGVQRDQVGYERLDATGMPPSPPSSESGLGGGASGGAVPVYVTNWPAAMFAGAAAAGAGGSGEPPSADVAAPAEDEQPEEPKPPRVNKGGVRRKRLNARSVGTEANLDQIHTYEPDGLTPSNQDAEEGDFVQQFTQGKSYMARAANRGMEPSAPRFSQPREAPVSPAEKRFIDALENANDVRIDAAQSAANEQRFDREDKYRSGANPTAAEKDFLAALQDANKPDKNASGAAAVKHGIIGTPSDARVEEAAGRLGVDLNLEDEASISGSLTSSPDPRVLKARAARLRASRSLPQRALSTSMVQIAQNAFGGVEGPQQRLIELGNRTSDVERTGYQLQDVNAERERISQKRSKLRTAMQAERTSVDPVTGLPRFANRAAAEANPDYAVNKKKYDDLGKSLGVLSEKSKLLSRSLAIGAVDVDKLAKNAVTGGDVLRNLGAGFIGGIAGGLVTGALSQVVGSITTVGGELLNQAMGNVNQISAERKGLGTATQAAAGRGDIAVAQAGAASGLSEASYATMAPLLTEAAQIEAGNNAFSKQADQFRLYMDTNRRGGAAGVSQTLGGAFGTFINGTAPMEETAGRLIGQNPSAPKTGFEADLDRAVMDFFDPQGTNSFFDETRKALGSDDAKDAGETFKFLNDMLNKGGESAIEYGSALGVAQEELDRQAATIQNPTLAGQVRDRQVAIFEKGTEGKEGRDAGPKLATGDLIAKEEAAALKRASTPEVSELLEANRQQLQNQLFAQNLMQVNQAENINPQTTAMANAAEGFGTLGGPGGPSATSGTNFSDQSPARQKSLNAELGRTQKLYDQINASTDQGITDAKAFVQQFNPEQAVAFGDALGKVMDYGKDIANIKIGVETQNAALAANQYANSIYMAKRSLQDAKGLMGLAGGKNNLGAIERQQFLLQRESQGLGLGLNQKQINFSLAQASFQSPGDTSEERAARKEQAKIEAEYAQKQLDIQKKLFGLGKRSFDISGARNIRDIGKQIDLLEQGRTVTLNTIAAEKKIIALTKLQAAENKKVETYYNTAVQRSNDVIGYSQSIANAAGKAMKDITTAMIKEFQRYFKDTTDTMTNWGTSPGASGGSVGLQGKTLTEAQKQYEKDHNVDLNGNNIIGRATGIVGMATSPTTMLVGEAGNETVAVLRNPRSMLSPMGGGGGGGNTTVIINNPVVRKDQDIAAITVSVERALNRRAALIGMRSLR